MSLFNGDFDNLTDEELAIAKYRCDNSLLYFTRFWYRILRGTKFIVNWHHEDMCNNLDDVSNYTLSFLGISIAPRMSKTELAAVNFIARGISKNPSSNWLYITASDELRSETSTRIRDIVSHPYFKRMYGIELKKDQSAKNLWRTNKGGGLKTATIFGQITGFGAGQMIEHNEELENYLRDFEGCIVMDDINKTDDAENLTANNTKVTRVISNTVLSRKNSADTPIINIQQRAGTEDAQAYFMKLYAGDPKARFMIYPIIKDGESLWPWKMPMEEIKKLEKSPETSHVFQTQYMQNPQPLEGLMFPESEIKRFEKLNDQIEDVPTFAYVDTADDGEDSLSMPIVKIINEKCFLIDVIFTKENLTITEDQIVAKCKELKIDYLFVENNKEGSLFVGNLRKRLPDISISGIRNTTKKTERIWAQSGWIMNNIYFKKEYDSLSEYGKFMKELTGYLKTGKVKHDDAPDSIAGLSKILRNRFYYLFDSE